MASSWAFVPHGQSGPVGEARGHGGRPETGGDSRQNEEATHVLEFRS